MPNDTFDHGALWVLNQLAADADVSNDTDRVLRICLADSPPEFRALLLEEGTDKLKRAVRKLVKP